MLFSRLSGHKIDAPAPGGRQPCRCGTVFAPTKAQRASSVTNQWTRNSITAVAVGMEEVSTAGMQQWGGASQTSYNRTGGVKVFIEQEVPALTRVVNGQTEHARMDLVFNINGSVTYLGVSIVASFSYNPSLVSAASTKPGLMAKRAEENTFDRYPHINLVPFILETTGRPGPTRWEIH